MSVFTSGHNAANGAQILQQFVSFLNLWLKCMYHVIDTLLIIMNDFTHLCHIVISPC